MKMIDRIYPYVGLLSENCENQRIALMLNDMPGSGKSADQLIVRMVDNMIQRIVDIIIEKQLKNQSMTAEDEKIYRYGYVLLFEVILNFFIALIIGIAFKEIRAVLFFLCTYIPLRSFCGGWHADKIWKCTVTSNIILLLQVYGIKNILEYLSNSGMLIGLVISILCILRLAPVETEMKRISKSERTVYKKKICYIILIHLIVMIIMIKLNWKELIFSMLYVYIIQNIMLLVEKLKKLNKEEVL